MMHVPAGLLTLACLVAAVSAHTTVYGLWVNGAFQGDGRNLYIRSPPNNNPVKDLSSNAMACNVNNRVVPNTVSVQQGDLVTFEWYHDTRDDDIIASSHKGPVQVYIAPTSSNGAGPVWTKLFSDSYENGLWAVDKLILAHGQHSVTIPDIPAGDYLLRAEIAALHEANVAYTSNPIRGVQMYMSCSQIRVTSNGTEVPPGGTSFPGTYTSSTPGIVWNLYDPFGNPAAYQAPGPAVWDGADGGSIAQVGSA
ncbi:hypothetical protein PC9H_009445 [Pleurotus ostreatus]|uniref:AA9 family lytic polysaccharide monooxygenase n=1 Tax=Pleurotus ostreatus TaxID=5322 RepID=A0A8H6ZP31_PLEOS|nr:uncharacterized protein PC9H_009445 [Pleurotus ostreatus]KAF7424142.1 hypothetical protein PC9H_009445 [Pleurotus ostreatus]KAJ8693013.1 hypothetical protein PTI98_010268 [Pleurotus ostreatus]